MTKKTIAAALAAVASTAIAASPAQANHITTALGQDGLSVLTFPTDKPSRTLTFNDITGTTADVVGIDRRPKNGELIAVTRDSKLYVLNASTGVATFRSQLSQPLVGDQFGVDFNPTVDRLRVVSDADQNLRINVDTGATTVDGPLNYAATDAFAGTNPTITGAAYTNNDSDFIGPATPTNPAPANATGTRLYDIDADLGTLAIQEPPNNGTLVTVGPLGQDDFREVGFDIFSNEDDNGRATGDVAYASLGKNGTEKLYTVDLVTGETDLIGPFGEQGVRDIAVGVVQQPTR